MKVCPKCGIVYNGLENYCSKCGIQLEKQKNVCSAMKTTMCKHRVYADDDNFCVYCGAPTTYAVERNGLKAEARKELEILLNEDE